MQKPHGLRLGLLGQIGSISARTFEKPMKNIVANLVSYRKEAVMKLNNNFSFSCFSLFFFLNWDTVDGNMKLQHIYVILYYISIKEIPDLRISSNGFRI